MELIRIGSGFFDGEKPYFAVTLEKKQKAAELMAETVRLMRNEK